MELANLFRYSINFYIAVFVNIYLVECAGEGTSFIIFY